MGNKTKKHVISKDILAFFVFQVKVKYWLKQTCMLRKKAYLLKQMRKEKKNTLWIKKW